MMNLNFMCVAATRGVLLALITFGTLLSIDVEARVTRIVIAAKESPTYGGQTFGTIGQYEKLIGTAFGEINPNDPHNAIITDILLAPRNVRGNVEYAATFTLIKPIDMSKGNSSLLYQVVNRGGRGQAYNIGGDPGDGFIQKRGYALLWSGWQGDVVPAPNNGNETVQVPIAKNPDGSSITGPVIFRFWNEPAGTTTVALTSVPPGAFTADFYAPATLDTTKATLTTHASESQTAVTGAVTTIASADWAWADCRTVSFPGTPDPTRICLKNGVDPTLLYQLVYVAKDPFVLGVGLAAMRDVISFFRYGASDDAGTANPVANAIQYVLGQGTSQAGNALKTFIQLGFNEDESRRIVIQGANPYIAARQTPINFRWAFPGGAATLYEPGSEPALWWEDYPDTTRARSTAGMLDRCRLGISCPKIVESFGATEFWDLRMSPGHIGTDAKADIPLPADVRRYYMPGTNHGGGAGGFSLSTGRAGGTGGSCLLQNNPNPEIETQRALFVALADWVTNSVEPPPSAYPRLADGTLVPATQAATGFPTLPGVPGIDGLVNAMVDYDFGPAFIYNDMSGVISQEPPNIKQVIPTYVVKVNSDGNEVAGIPSLLHQLPLGTYTGWNVVTTGYNKGRICAFTGGFLPFANTQADRIASGDPRPSLAERYSFVGYYYSALYAVNRMVQNRYLLPEDASRLFNQALQGILSISAIPVEKDLDIDLLLTDPVQ